MSFLEGFAQGFTQERNRRLEKEQRNEELKLQYAMPELMKRKGEWEAKKQEEKDMSDNATMLANQAGDPSFYNAAMQELKAKVPVTTIQERIQKGHYVQKKKDATVVVPTDPTAPVSTPSAIANPMPRADSTPMTTDGVVTPLPKAPVAVPEAVKAKGPVGPTGDASEGPVDPNDTTTRRVDGKLFEGINKVSPDMAQFYKDSPDTLRTEDKPIADSGWTLKADAVEGKLSPGMESILKDPVASKNFIEAVNNGTATGSDVDIAAAKRSAESLVADPAKALPIATSVEGAKQMLFDAEQSGDPKAIKRAQKAVEVWSEPEKPKVNYDIDYGDAVVVKNSPTYANLTAEQKSWVDSRIKMGDETTFKKLDKEEAQYLADNGATPEEKTRGQNWLTTYDKLSKLAANDDVELKKSIKPEMDAGAASVIKTLYEEDKLNLNSTQMTIVNKAIQNEQDKKTEAQNARDSQNEATSGNTYWSVEGDTVGNAVEKRNGKFYSNGVEVPESNVVEFSKQKIEKISDWEKSTDKDRNEITSIENTAKSIIRSGNIVKEMDPNAFTKSASVILGVANTVSKELEAINTIFSGQTDMNTPLGALGSNAATVAANKANEILSGANANLYDDATKIAIIKLDLAYKNLASNGQEGNAVSRAELENAITAVGNDKPKFLNYIKSRVDEAKAAIKDKYQSIMSRTETQNLRATLGGRLPKSIKDLEKKYGNTEPSTTENIPEVLTAEDYAKVKSGSYYKDSEGKQRKKK